MKKIELVKGISSSVLGFGCAPILGAVGAVAALRAIDCAIDNGINHFDLARSYGYGEAEQFVGKALKGKRNSVVLASKFGMAANWKASILRPAKPVIRYFLKALKPNARQTHQPGKVAGLLVSNSLHNYLRFDAETMSKSLEKSLRQLNTDHLDYFFLHEPLQTIDNIDELFGLAEQLKTEGKIRAFGLAFMSDQKPAHKTYIEKFDLLQFNNSSNTIEYKSALKTRQHKPNVIFSPLKNTADNLTPVQKLTKLSADFPHSVVLCSMFNEIHIKENALVFK